VPLDAPFLDWVPAAVLVTDLTGHIVFANPYCLQVYGRSPDDLLGTDAQVLSLEPLPSELSQAIAREVFAGRSWDGEFRVVRSDGSAVEVHSIDTPLFGDDGKISGVVSITFDVTAQRLDQDEMQRVLAVAQILRDVGQTLVAELDTDKVMQTVVDAARHLTSASVGAFLREAEHGAPGLVVAVSSGRAEAFACALDATLGSREARLQSCMVAPVHSRSGREIGALVVAHAEPDRFTRNDERLLADIAAQSGIALDIGRLFRAAEVEIAARRRAEQVQRFYAETSAVLSSSLSLPQSFERIGHLCVPFLADLCVIDVADEHGGLRRAAAVHADPAKADLARELAKRYPPDPYGAHPAASIVRGGESVLAPSISEDIFEALSRDDRHREIVRALEFTSYMCVPLAARGRTLGALTLISSGSGRRFGPDDLALAHEFGRRAGLALDNARLYSERDHVARALQSSLLPPNLPSIAGVQLAARYRAAGEGNAVGGDFYHVFQVDAHAWWIVIGDVSGKGPEAAAIAGLARHTLRAVAVQERSPSRLLEALHETLLREGRGEFCTVCCALLEPHENGASLSVARGGHPPPVVRRADRRVEVVECSGPLLGVPVRVEFVEQKLILGPGDTALFYTDGVTDAHERRQELFGEARLFEVFGNAPDDVDSMGDAIVAAVSEYGPDEPRDDLAVIVARIGG
jgi:PAS domain S-box-containing protein